MTDGLHLQTGLVSLKLKIKEWVGVTLALFFLCRSGLNPTVTSGCECWAAVPRSPSHSFLSDMQDLQSLRCEARRPWFSAGRMRWCLTTTQTHALFSLGPGLTSTGAHALMTDTHTVWSIERLHMSCKDGLRRSQYSPLPVESDA